MGRPPKSDVHFLEEVMAHAGEVPGVGDGEIILNRLLHGALAPFESQHVGASLPDEPCADLALTAHGINADDASGKF